MIMILNFQYIKTIMIISNYPVSLYPKKDLFNDHILSHHTSLNLKQLLMVLSCSDKAIHILLMVHLLLLFRHHILPINLKLFPIYIHFFNPVLLLRILIILLP
jgi:hypothetical protein